MKTIKALLVGICVGSTTIMAQSPVNSLHFDGTDDYVSTALPAVFNNISSNDFTIEAWIKPQGNTFSRIVFAQSNATNFASVSLSASNQVYFYVNNVVGQVSSASLPVGVWSHVACTWDASTSLVEIYINGILETTSSGGSSSTGTDNLMTIGARTNAAQFFLGELDEVRIWNVVRTPCEIYAAMSSEFNALQPNMVAYYKFNEGVAGAPNAGVTALPDLSTNYNGTLLNFGLTGANSNWVTSGAAITNLNQNNGVVNGTDVRTECDAYTWIDGNTYASSNNSATYNIVGGSVNGCDSLVSLDLTIVNSTTGTDVRTECDAYTWIDGNTYTSSNNVATYNIAGGAANGCDSLVMLDLTINSVSDLSTTVTGITLSANNTSATYQWLDCDDNYAVINGATNQNYTPTINGNYAVELTENGCADTSVCQSITTVGILENSFGEALHLYPNPTSGNFSIDLGSVYENVQVSIVDVTGRLIDSRNISQSQLLNFTLAESAGIYMVSITAGDKSAIVRLIKE